MYDKSLVNKNGKGVYNRIELVKPNGISFWKYRVRVVDKDEFQRLIEVMLVLPEALVPVQPVSGNNLKYVKVVVRTNDMKVKIKSLTSLSAEDRRIAQSCIDALIKLKEK